MTTAADALLLTPPPAALAPDEEAGLWQRWRGADDALAHQALMALHLPYARTLAATYYARRFNDEIEFDDYLQLARLALIEAMNRFDPQHGAQFRTYAARRIHGAILDGIEVQTEKQQQIYARQRLLSQRRDDMAATLNATAAGTAAAPEASRQEKLLALVAEAGIAFALGWLLDGTRMVQLTEHTHDLPVYRSLEVAQLRQRIHQLVNQLPAQERRVVAGHYLQQEPFEDIALQMQLSRGRVSQIHRRGLGRLKEMSRRAALFDETA